MQFPSKGRGGGEHGVVFDDFSPSNKGKEQESPLLVTDPVIIPIPDESRTSIMSSRSSRAHVTWELILEILLQLYGMDKV